jgi:hypothetical protein
LTTTLPWAGSEALAQTLPPSPEGVVTGERAAEGRVFPGFQGVVHRDGEVVDGVIWMVTMAVSVPPWPSLMV